MIFRYSEGMKLLVHFVSSVAALMLISYVVPGFVVTDIYTAIEVAVVLGLVNLLIRPIILLVTLPINLITLGLFTFVVNALLIWGVALFVHLSGFVVTGFKPALIAALILAVVHWVAHRLVK